jgi:hypothetical protein
MASGVAHLLNDDILRVPFASDQPGRSTFVRGADVAGPFAPNDAAHVNPPDLSDGPSAGTDRCERFVTDGPVGMGRTARPAAAARARRLTVHISNIWSI